MGRRSVRLDEPDRWIFNRLAGAYRSRPPYPGELVDRLFQLAGGAGTRVVDLGAGMGHLAIPLAERGAIVAAVEPAREMLSALRARTPAALGDRVHPVHAAAEATSLPGGAFDLALLADALQWVDPELAGAEAARLLRRGGTIAVVETSFADTPFMRGLAALLGRANPKTRDRPPGALRQLLALAAPHGGSGRAVPVERFVQESALEDASLADLLRSMSHVGPALGPARLAELIEEARRLAARSGGARLTRDFTLHWAVTG